MTSRTARVSRPAAAFDAPLEMLSSCHDRLARHFEALRRLVVQVAANGADEPACNAAAGALRCFDTSARDHHADEEQDLFPAMLEALAGSDPVCVRELTRALTADHRALESAWQRVRGPLQQIAAGCAAPLASVDVEALIALYERHIEREENELLPMAARVLDDGQLARIGRAMCERRAIREG